MKLLQRLASSGAARARATSVLSAGACPLARRAGVACMSSAHGTEQQEMRGIHFEQEEADAAQRPFRIVGVRDVEVADWEYPTRVEEESKKGRVLRNRFQHPNFISLWVDQLAEVETYLKKEQIPFASEGITRGPDGYDVLVIPPSDDGSSVEFFNLCDNPTMVEVVQATPEVIKEFEGEDDE